VVIARRSLELWHDERWRLSCALDDAQRDLDDLEALTPGPHQAALTDARRALVDLMDAARTVIAVSM
jgi:hypothetical protein